ncbi:MAG: protein kinase [Bradymonadales bacterium]|nr:protein kinase [Bradymonadales bacterium]
MRPKETQSGLGAPIRLGQLLLSTCLGKGGMGEVWRASHLPSRAELAVKLVTRAHAREPAFRRAIQHEVRSMARLSHPAILALHDMGIVTPDEQAASQGLFKAGTPYMVMELARQGSLDEVPVPIAWAELRGLLDQILGGLAHAHARGVIHRDLKPANVLLTSDERGEGQVKLADFGIARALEEPGEQGSLEYVAGTPDYMAPEQFEGNVRDQGPWTDLYSLGCMAFELATGSRPFQGKNLLELAEAHATAAIPAVPPHLPVPKELNDWLRRLLQKRPQHRFQSVAEARHELGLLEWDMPDASHQLTFQSPPTESWLDRTTANWGQTEMDDTTVPMEPLPSTKRGTRPQVPLQASISRWGLPVGEQGRPSSVALPVPETWRLDEDRFGQSKPVCTGLGVFGLRRIPLVDRDRERDLLWHSLRQVSQDRQPKAILVEGRAGVGKSRLCEWFVERALELGVALVLKATHGASGMSMDGLGGMLVRHFRCAGQNPAQVRGRIAEWAKAQAVEEPHFVRVLGEVMNPTGSARSAGGHGHDTMVARSERYRAIALLLMHLAHKQPVLLYLDDVQWAADSLFLVQYLLPLGQQGSFPLLIVMTARQEEIEVRPVERREIEALQRSCDVTRIPLAPLAGDDRQVLVQKILGLTSSLAREVEQRSEGNPLFAVQLIGDWVQRGVLVSGQDGFGVLPGETAVLPRQIHEIWEARLQQLKRSYQELAARQVAASTSGETLDAVLQIAAVLGRQVDQQEWEEACAQLGIEVSPELTELLLSLHLGEKTDSGWSFVHALLRDWLEDLARKSGRLEAYHLACGEMLERLYPQSTTGISERVGRHLFLAGTFGRALSALGIAIAERYYTDDFEIAWELMELYDRALDGLKVRYDPSDDRVIEGWIWKSKLLRLKDRHREAEAVLASLQETLDPDRAPAYMSQVLLELANLANLKGERARSLELAKQATSMAQKAQDLELLVICLIFQGSAEREIAQYEEALAHLERAQRLAREAGMDRALARANTRLATALTMMGDSERPPALYEDARAIFERLGDRLNLSSCLNDLGEFYRIQGELDRASACYLAVFELFKDTPPSAAGMLPLLNLAIVALEREEYEEARSYVTRLEQQYRALHNHAAYLFRHFVRLPLAVVEGDRQAFALHFEQARVLFEEKGWIEKDSALTAQLAARKAIASGEREWARLTGRLAHRIWMALGMQDKAGEVEQMLRSLTL